jgi:hypothetical protein
MFLYDLGENSMFKKAAISVGLGLALSAPTYAQQYIGDVYKWEVDGAVEAGEFSGNFNDTDFNSYNIEGSYFFKGGVNNTKGPFSEAYFLDRGSDVTVFYDYAEIDDNGIDVDGDQYGVSGRYVIGDGGWIVAGSYARQEPLDAQIDTFTLSAGKYIFENTSLVANYWNGDADEGGDTDGYGVSLDHFWGFSNNNGIKFEGNYGFVNVDNADDIDIYNIGATWYPTQRLGFGGAFGKFDAGGIEADRYSAKAEYFIIRGIAANLEYVYDELDDSDFEVKSIALGVTLRY